MRVCAFCGTEGRPLTLEHVYPDWLSGYFKHGLMGINEVGADGKGRVWSEAIFQHKAKVVCANCNNGWMSTLETAAKPFLEGLIFTTNPKLLDAAAQQTLAFWAQKTVLMVNKGVGGAFKIPAKFYQELYAQKQPLGSIMVTLGWRMQASGNKNEPLATFEIKQIDSAITDKQSEAHVRERIAKGEIAWVATLGLGRMVFQFFGNGMKDATLHIGGNDPRVFPAIHPFETNIDWPNEWPIEALGGLDTVRKGM